MMWWNCHFNVPSVGVHGTYRMMAHSSLRMFLLFYIQHCLGQHIVASLTFPHHIGTVFGRKSLGLHLLPRIWDSGLAGGRDE